MNTRTELRRDVAVVGCGIAGLSAAVSALEGGASVVCLERSGIDDFGGNTRWTDAYFRMKDEHTVSDDFEEALISNAGHNLDPNIIRHVADPYESWPGYVKAFGMTDPELVSTLSAQAGPTVQWLKRFGIRFDALPTYFMTAAAPRLMPVGGGLALIEALRAQALSAGGEILYETAARKLDRNEDDDSGGWILQAIGPQGRAVKILARSVILASGGFQGNPEMLGQYIGPTARYLRPVARGGWYNKGEGIRMALAAGAAPAGDFTSYHAEPVDPRALRPEGLVMNFPYGILVNRVGHRFIDEAPGPVDLHYDPIARSIKDQPDGLVHVIFDASIDDVPNWKRSIRTEQAPLQADTLDALARLCDINPESLRRTIDEYNRCCTTGGPFSPLTVDGLSTQGLAPPKSNWARPIERAPFFAYPIISTVCFTYGGIKTDSQARVVDTDGRPIPGLYAAGEMTGLYHQVYTGATSVMRGAVFGRLAGQHAAAA